MKNHNSRSVFSQHRLLPTTVTTDYWVVDERGGLADPDLIVGVPGAAATQSPYSVAVETPACESCAELQQALGDRLEAAVAAAHERGCRLLALGVRPDLLTEGGVADWDQPPPAVTAGSRITFDTGAAGAVDCYNTLLALDPAFALVNTTSRVDGDTQYACGRPSLYHHGPTARYRSGHTSTATAPVDHGGEAAWRPVELIDDSTVEWRSLDATDPTLLVDLIADVKTILRRAGACRIGFESFGNGFHGDRLVLPSEEWRQIYTEEAVRQGLSSLLVGAYLERLGIETGWYRAAALPAVSNATDLSAICRRRAAHLEADVGYGVV